MFRGCNLTVVCVFVEPALIAVSFSGKAYLLFPAVSFGWKTHLLTSEFSCNATDLVDILWLIFGEVYCWVYYDSGLSLEITDHLINFISHVFSYFPGVIRPQTSHWETHYRSQCLLPSAPPISVEQVHEFACALLLP